MTIDVVRRFPPSLLAAAVMSCAAPGAGPGTPAEQVLLPHLGEEAALAPIEGVERLEADGPFFAGASERFRALLTDDVDVRWSATAGALHSDGAEVVWDLPDAAGRQILSAVVDAADGTSTQYDFPIMLLSVAPGASGPVDTGPDATGSQCDLAIDGSDVPHILYRNDAHDQWWYATFVGGAWSLELVDGPGFGVGGIAASTYNQPTILVDANGDIQAAFQREDDEVVHATRAGGSWTVETLPNEGESSRAVAFTTGVGGIPVIVTDGPWEQPRVHYRPNATWLTSDYTNAPNTFEYSNRGAIASRGPNQFWIPLGEDELYAVEWSVNGGFGALVDVSPNECCNHFDRATIHTRPTGEVGILGRDGLYWSTDFGSTYDRNGVLEEFVERRSFELDGTTPKLAIRHGSTLEFVEPDARDYWDYTVMVTGTDAGAIGTALDTSGTLHACFQKDGQIWFQ